jgi:hypothetical protein
VTSTTHDYASGPLPNRWAWPLWWTIRLLGVCALLGLIPYVMGTGFVLGDVHLYDHWSAMMWHGHLPYRDWSLEYPPGAVAVAMLPHPSKVAFHLEFLSLALAADAAVLALLRRSGRPRGVALWLAAPVLLGPVFWARLDVFVAAALVGALIALERRRFAAASVLLTFGGLLKLWPFLVLAFVVVAVRGGAWRRVIVASAATLATFILPVLAYGGSLAGLTWTLRYQARRGLEIESVPAAGAYVWRIFGGHVAVERAWGCYQLLGRYTSPVGTAFSVLLVAAVAAVAWRLRDRMNVASTGYFATGLVAALLVTSKVLSPQYFVWAAAAVAVIVDHSRARVRLAAWTSVALLSTQAVFPFGFSSLKTAGMAGAALGVVHAVLVMSFAWVVWQEIRLPRTRAACVPPVDIRQLAAAVSAH